MNETLTTSPLDRLETTRTRVRVVTPSGVIEGNHAHPPGVRLSDSLRNAVSGERYMLLTDTVLRGLDGTPAAHEFERAPFVLVNASHASVIVPLEDA
jgi:hypothetical protein